MGNGNSPDIDGFAKLISWLGQPAESFLRGPKKVATEGAGAVAVVSAYLRASKDLSSESIKFLEAVFEAAYAKVKGREEKVSLSSARVQG